MTSHKIRRILTIPSVIILFSLIGLPNLLFYAVTNQPVKLLESFFLISGIFLLPVIFMRKYLKIYCIILSFIGFISILASLPVIYFGLILNTEVMELIYNSSYTEATELMGGYLWQIILFLVLYITIVILIIKIIPSQTSKKVVRVIFFFYMAVILIIPVFGFGIKGYPTNFRNTLFSYYPFYIEYYGKQFYKEIKLYKEHPELVENFHFYSKQIGKIPGRQIYVFFIGESSRYDHWGINGYPRDTSPSLSKEKNLISFKNVCAAGGMTELSVPMILTQTKPYNFIQHNYEKSIIALFGEAGFRTYWISDQVDGVNVMMHAKEADSLILLQSTYNGTSHVNYDMELMAKLKSIINSDTGNLFIVLHTLGSHFAYNFRYPENYDYFRPSEGKKVLQPNDKNLKQIYINQYDNSILYTDAVIDSAIHLISSNSTVSFLYYISDHGENLFDDDRDLFQHEPVKPSIYVAHVPLFIYTSNAYNMIFPEKVSTLKNHINSKISGSDSFNTLANLANLVFKRQDSTQSFASGAFNDSTRIILGGDNKIYNYRDL